MQICQKLKQFSLACLIVTGILTSPSALSALVEAPLPSNTYITMNGFDWAWGASCVSKNASDCDTIDDSYQQALGWSIAQASDMPLAPTALDFLFAGANVPFGGVDPVSGAAFEYTNSVYTDAASAGACASSYFTLGDGNNTCDWSNGSGQGQNTSGWYNENGESNFFADVLYVREAVVPVPAAVWLFSTALITVVGFKRRNR